MSPKEPITPCTQDQDFNELIKAYSTALEREAWEVGDHGMAREEFRDSGLFRAAVEKIRGSQAASQAEKRQFVASILMHLLEIGTIDSWEFSGGGERHDYEVVMPGGWTTIIETKGCLDGNNTNIFQRPANADEFLIWSLCQSPGADPRHNAGSGIHTRLGAEMIHSRELINGLIIWDMICGTVGRPCPKLDLPIREPVELDGRVLPPPCIYLFPRSVPEPRNNPDPPCATLGEVRFLQTLHTVFGGFETEITQVHIEARMEGSNTQRRTTLRRGEEVFKRSRWTTIKRAV